MVHAEQIKVRVAKIEENTSECGRLLQEGYAVSAPSGSDEVDVPLNHLCSKLGVEALSPLKNTHQHSSVLLSGRACDDFGLQIGYESQLKIRGAGYWCRPRIVPHTEGNQTK